MRRLLWFKQDLRLDDHPAVQAALGAERVLPLYVFDPTLLRPGPLGTRPMGVHRMRFLLESLAALDGELRHRGSRLLVVQGVASQVIPALVDHLQLDEVLTLDEVAPAARTLIEETRQALAGVPLTTFAGDTLLRREELPAPVEALPAVFSQFRDQVQQRLSVFQPRSAPAALPPTPEPADRLFEPLPSLSRLGLGEPLAHVNSTFPFAGGEPAALARVRDYLWEGRGVRDYETTRYGLTGTEYSSKFSPWLANGCLSARRVVAELRRHEAQYGANASTRLLWEQVLWRDFFRWTLLRHGEALFQPGGVRATARAPQNLDARFEAWCHGRTGLPLVDAAMRELATTGFLAYRLRQVVASYLVSDLQQDWRHGAAWFEEHLLDHDPASNWGNWAYLAGVASDPQRSQAFNALRQARHLDPEAEYVSLWLPELRAVPRNLRHTPFVLSRLQLDALDYPRLEQVPEAWKPYLTSAA
ncbi:DASH family cryptochrome [Metapseudomonas otitidis]|uniref:DASH family cryptochrome n=1 Tax=Metapseudomonas otitidis TaxID=319939 RepID=UPI0032163934